MQPVFAFDLVEIKRFVSVHDVRSAIMDPLAWISAVRCAPKLSIKQ